LKAVKFACKMPRPAVIWRDRADRPPQCATRGACWPFYKRSKAKDHAGDLTCTLVFLSKPRPVKRGWLPPETIKKLIGQGHKVTVQSGAGINASVVDSAYEAAGAIIGSASDAFGAELILKVVAQRQRAGADQKRHRWWACSTRSAMKPSPNG
jgi:hypothetical protein